MRLASLILTSAILLLLVAAIVTALGFPEEARRVPLVIAVPTASLAALQLVRDATMFLRGDRGGEGTSGGTDENVSYARAEDDGADGADSAGGQATGEATVSSHSTSTLGAFAWVFGLVGMFLLLGMLVTVVLFMVVFSLIYGRERLRTIVIQVGGTFVVVYFGFSVLLDLRLYDGVLWGWLW